MSVTLDSGSLWKLCGFSSKIAITVPCCQFVLIRQLVSDCVILGREEKNY